VGRWKTYTACTALPALASRMVARLYELRSLVRPAFHSIGRVLAAKMDVEMVPVTASGKSWKLDETARIR
jgi:hypothetical protein